MSKITIYSTPTCGYCSMAKDYFDQNNLEYEEKDVAMDETAREEMLSKSGQMGVPVIEVGEEIIVGFDQQRLGQVLGI